MFKVLTDKFYPSVIELGPGDTIRLTYYGDNNRVERIEHTVTETKTYNQMAIVEFTNELGFDEGIAAVIGRKN